MLAPEKTCSPSRVGVAPVLDGLHGLSSYRDVSCRCRPVQQHATGRRRLRETVSQGIQRQVPSERPIHGGPDRCPRELYPVKSQEPAAWASQGLLRSSGTCASTYRRRKIPCQSGIGFAIFASASCYMARRTLVAPFPPGPPGEHIMWLVSAATARPPRTAGAGLSL